MTDKPVMLMDVDGVIADFTGSYLKAVERVTGRVYRREQVNRWEIAACCELTSEEKSDVTDIVVGPGFCADISILPGAKEGIKMVRGVADVVFVTSPWTSSRTWCYERRKWLRREFDAAEDEVIQTSAKWRVDGDFIADDKPSAVEAWAKAHPTKKAVLWADHSNSQVHEGNWWLKTNRWGDLVVLATTFR